ncbi:MAG: YfiR family protein [Cyclobacteriaceae bacterium]|nr:YfiR family protein [Cyclobacteriaceae bacterium]
MKKLFLLVILTVVLGNASYAQKEKYQSLFIYNFTKYIKWPDNYNAGKFVIGVIGNSEVMGALSTMAESKKKTGTGQDLEVKKYASVSDIGECNILFVSENVVGNLEQIESLTASKPILIVSDSPGMATKGAVINFVEQDGKIKFELNESQASKRRLVVSGSLTSLAIMI